MKIILSLLIVSVLATNAEYTCEYDGHIWEVHHVYYVPEQCKRLTCEFAGHILEETCDRVGSGGIPNKENCQWNAEVDTTKRYPGCCGHWDCEEQF